ARTSSSRPSQRASCPVSDSGQSRYHRSRRQTGTDSFMKRSNLALSAILFVLGLAVVVGGAVALLQQAARPAVTASSEIGGAFSLVDQDGEMITEETVRGSPFVVFFGFTHCPDICPAKLYELSEVLKAMGDDGERLPVLFVSVDPER